MGCPYIIFNGQWICFRSNIVGRGAQKILIHSRGGGGGGGWSNMQTEYIFEFRAASELRTRFPVSKTGLSPLPQCFMPLSLPGGYSDYLCCNFSIVVTRYMTAHFAFCFCIVMLALWSSSVAAHFAFCFCIVMLALWSSSTAAHFAFCLYCDASTLVIFYNGCSLCFLFVLFKCLDLGDKIEFCMSKGLSPFSSFPTDSSKEVHLLQFFFVCALVVSYVASFVLLLFVPYFSSPEPKAHWWAYHMARLLSVCVVCSHFQTSSLEPLGRLKLNFMWGLHGMGKRKFAYGVQVT